MVYPLERGLLGLSCAQPVVTHVSPSSGCVSKVHLCFTLQAGKYVVQLHGISC